jgi:hypothetical protein
MRLLPIQAHQVLGMVVLMLVLVIVLPNRLIMPPLHGFFLHGVELQLVVAHTVRCASQRVVSVAVLWVYAS